nr:hypothetical protein [Nordella sp. HKS 07]
MAIAARELRSPHHSGDTGLDGFDAGRARVTIDRRELAEDRAGSDVPEGHPLPVRRVDADPRQTFQQEEDVEGFVIVADDQLQRAIFADGALLRQLGESSLVERLEISDRSQCIF